jgi:hypothetical protein
MNTFLNFFGSYFVFNFIYIKLKTSTMKKVILMLSILLSLTNVLNAQVENKAIGLRLGSGFGYGAEISYQQPLSKINRLELDLGLNSWGFGLNGIYHWVWDLSALADGFNWYAGFGAGIGSYNFGYVGNPNGSSNFSIGAVGQVGIEYKFEVPLTLSLDYRPGMYFLNGFNSSIDGICIAGRYRF